MKKRFGCWLLTLAMVLTLLPAEAVPVRAAAVSVGTWADFESALTGASDGDVITLTADIKDSTAATGYISITKSVTLDLNGHVIDFNGKARGLDLAVNGASLTLNDGNRAASHTITSPVTNSPVAISGGLITGCAGMTVVVHSYTGVSVAFTMNAGTIAGNSSGVVDVKGTVTINGGALTHNSVSGPRVVGGDRVYMHGGSVTNNRFTNAVASPNYYAITATLYLSGRVTIQGNTDVNGHSANIDYRAPMFIDGMIDPSSRVYLDPPAGSVQYGYTRIVYNLDRSGLAEPDKVFLCGDSSYAYCQLWCTGGEALAYTNFNAVTLDPNYEGAPEMVHFLYMGSNGTTLTTSNTGYGGSYTEPRRTGYTFKGWTISPDGMVVRYRTGDTITGDRFESDRQYLKVLRLYAVWEEQAAPVSYTVTFDKNDSDASGTMDPITVTDGKLTLPACGFTAPRNKTFSQWQIGETLYNAGTEVSITGNTTVKAVWTPIVCTITFNKNADTATGTMDPQEIDAGSRVSLKANQFRREGYDFAGWNTRADGGGDSYQNRGSITPTANMTLYAQWAKDTLTVTFDANGGEGTMEPQTIPRSQGTPLVENTFTRTGYVFDTWNTMPDGSGETYVDRKVVTLTSDLSLYAQWKVQNTEVRYIPNAQGVTGMPASSGEKVPGQPTTVTVVKPVREGYVFLGWATTEDAKTAEYEPGATLEDDTLAKDGVITLYAVWGKKDITVTFDKNGGYGTMTPQTFKNGVEDTLKANDYARQGYTFKYWNTAADGSGTDYEDKAKASFTEDTTLYAIWDPSVTYHANNTTADKFVQTIPLGASTVIKDNAFTRKGYNFKCWNTKADGSGTDYQPRQAVKLTENTDLYAIWTPYSYTVRFVANGGVGTMADQQFEYDKAQTLTPNAFTRTGRTFYGWSLTAGGEVKYADRALVKNLNIVDDNPVDGKLVLLYAVWDAPRTRTGSIWIQQGASVLQSVSPQNGDPYVFQVPAGVYNVVVTSGDRQMTTMVETTGGEVKGPSVLSPELANSVLEIVPGAPDVVVGNLERAAEENRVIGAKTELRMTVAQVAENTGEDHKAIRAMCPEGKALEFFDLKLAKTVNGATDETFSGECTENLIIRIPFTKAANKDITVYRRHDGKTTTLTTRMQGGEYIKVENNAVTIYAHAFSAYAICYTPKDPAVNYLNCPRNHVCPIQPFDDASPNSWYHDGVHWALEVGAMNGVTARRFYPNDSTTRAQLVTILWRLEGSPRGLYASFSDVPRASWFAEAVGWASIHGIVEGRSDEIFDPSGTLTREQLATILYRYVVYKTGYTAGETVGLGNFADAGAVSRWAYEGMDFLTSYGILDGMAAADGQRLLAPKGSATRAQVATVMMRCYQAFFD